MDKNCEDCPAKDVCGGNLEDLYMRLRQEYAGSLAMYAALVVMMGTNIPGVADTISIVFLAGYLTHVVEAAANKEHAPDLDRDVWGEISALLP